MNLIEHLEKLKHFKAVAEEGSFLAGGRRVNQTQQTVFYSVNRLEEAISSKLLTRSRKGVRLTAAGEFLLEQVNLLEVFIRDTQRTLDQLKDKPTKIKLGVNTTRFSSLIAPIYKKLKEIDGGLEVEPVLIESSKKMVDSVHSGNIDLAIVAEPILSKKHKIDEILLFKETYKFYKSTTWQFNYKNKSSKQILLNQKILFLPHAISTNNRSLGAELTSMGIPDTSINLTSFDSIIQLILHDEYIGVLPSSFVKNHVEKNLIELISIPRNLLPRFFHLKIIYRSESGLRKTAQAIKNVIKK